METEAKAMREIHEIRARLHEATKDMTPGEHTAYYRRKAEEVAEKHGLKLKRPASSPHDAAIR